MVEVVDRVIGHAEPFDDPARMHVVASGEGHDLVKTDLLEAEGQSRRTCLSGVAVAPVLAGEPSADFVRARQVVITAHLVQPGEAD